MLTDEQKEAVLQQRIIFWTNAMAEDIERENPVGVVDGFMDNWTEDQRRLFNEDWANDASSNRCLNRRITKWVKGEAKARQ